MPNLRTAYLVMCEECGRVFDLVNQDDEADWALGHDCEEQQEEDQ